jgi:hypothetical protein
MSGKDTHCFFKDETLTRGNSVRGLTSGEDRGGMARHEFSFRL